MGRAKVRTTMESWWEPQWSVLGAPIIVMVMNCICCGSYFIILCNICCGTLYLKDTLMSREFVNIPLSICMQNLSVAIF